MRERPFPGIARLSTRERAAWILAALALVFAVVGVGRPSFTNASRPVRGISAPAIAIEQARTLAEVDAILSDAPSPDREVLRLKQYIAVAFAAVCAALMIVIPFALVPFNVTARWGAWLILTLGCAAALCEILQAWQTLRLVDLPLAATTPAALENIRALSTAKWTLRAVSLLGLSLCFCTAREWRARAAGAAGILAALIPAAGLIRANLLEYAHPAEAAAFVFYAATLKFATHESPSRNSIPRSV